MGSQVLPRTGVITPEYLRDHILPHIVYRDTEFLLYQLNVPEEPWVLKMSRPTTDAYNPGRTAMQIFHAFLYGPLASEDDALKWIFKSILEMEHHEAGEWFHYQGERIYDPHK